MSQDDLPSETDYALVGKTVPEIAAPELPYKPPMPKSYRPKIALVGAGGISFAHLDAYPQSRTRRCSDHVAHTGAGGDA
jgi:hypothetical protein